MEDAGEVLDHVGTVRCFGDGGCVGGVVRADDAFAEDEERFWHWRVLRCWLRYLSSWTFHCHNCNWWSIKSSDDV